MKGAPSPPFRKRAQIPSQSLETEEVPIPTDIQNESRESKIAQLKKEKDFYLRIIKSQEKTILTLTGTIEKSENSQENNQNITSSLALKKSQEKHKYLINDACQKLTLEKGNSMLDPREIQDFLKMQADRQKCMDRILKPEAYKQNLEKQINDKNQKLKTLQAHLNCMTRADSFFDKEIKRNGVLKDQIESLKKLEIVIPQLEKNNAELRKQIAELEKGVKLQESGRNLSLLYENELNYYLILKQIEEFAKDNLVLEPH